MRAIVTGNRTWTNAEAIRAALRTLPRAPPSCTAGVARARTPSRIGSSDPWATSPRFTPQSGTVTAPPLIRPREWQQ